MATPAALPPASFGLRHRIRLARARARRGVEVEGRPYLGRRVALDVEPGARVRLGDGCSLGDGTRIHARAGSVVIGPGSVLGERCALVALAGVEIGRRCLIGDGVVLTDFEPGTADVERPTREQALVSGSIEVGDGARLGHGACLLRGVRVAAGAQVPPNTVVRGTAR